MTGQFTKLGAFGVMVVVPTVPVGAQMRQGYLHVLLEGGAYLSGAACTAPANLKPIIAAHNAKQKAGETEPTYSGSGNPYVKLDVVKVDGKQDVYALLLGSLEVCRVMVDPSVTITSTDESLKAQVMGHDDDETEDTD